MKWILFYDCIYTMSISKYIFYPSCLAIKACVQIYHIHVLYCMLHTEI